MIWDAALNVYHVIWHYCNACSVVLGTREASFVHAISAAGVGYAVTRACSTGQLEQCGCDRSIRGQSAEGFQWAGCSDNIAYGSAFSKNFVDAKERARGSNSDRALMNLHNNQAGRMVSRHKSGQNIQTNV